MGSAAATGAADDATRRPARMETRAARREAAAVDMACVMTGVRVGVGEDARASRE